MSRRRQRQHETAFFIVVATIASATYAVHSFATHDWNSALWSSCIAVGVPCWLFSLKAPTICGVPTKTGGRCRNITYGVLFGCGSAEGHTWTKFFSNLGWRRGLPVQTPPGQNASQPARSLPHPDTRIRPDSSVEHHDLRATIVFWASITATIAAIVSMTTDLIGLLTK
jgi:hypothetical protein